MSKHLQETDRAVIVHLHEQGLGYKAIAKQTEKNISTVRYTIKRYKEDGTLTDRSKPGRPRAATTRDDRILVRKSRQDRFKGSTALVKDLKESTGTSIAPRTARRILQKYGLTARTPRRKPMLTSVHRKRRLEWAKEHKSWSLEQWSKVIFSDESNFDLQNIAGICQYVRRSVGEAYKPQCVLPTVKHPLTVMIWGCFSARGAGRIHVCEGRMNAEKYLKVMEDKLLKSARDLYKDEEWIFQQDNAPCHTAKRCKEWFDTHGVKVLSWPAQSPDLNPIENLWHQIKLLVTKDKPTTKVTLIEAIVKAWYRLVTTERLENLVNSMPRRCRAVIHSKGWPTKY